MKGYIFLFNLVILKFRVYQTFLRMVFENVRNLCVIGGDAMYVLPSHIGDACLHSVYINHPEPPVQRGSNKRQKVSADSEVENSVARDSAGDAYGKHLLSLVSISKLHAHCHYWVSFFCIL